MFWHLGRYAEGRQSLAEALQIANQPGSDYKPLLAEIELSYAQIALSERKFSEGRARASKAVRLAQGPTADLRGIHAH